LESRKAKKMWAAQWVGFHTLEELKGFWTGSKFVGKPVPKQATPTTTCVFITKKKRG